MSRSAAGRAGAEGMAFFRYRITELQPVRPAEAGGGAAGSR